MGSLSWRESDPAGRNGAESQEGGGMIGRVSGRAIGAIAGALALALVAAPRAGAQGGREADEGRAMEREYGVIGRRTEEGRSLNEQLERVTSRVTSALGYRLKSAILLGGADEKHDKVINAFALPDGRIYVTLGLARAVRKSADPD